MTKLDFRLVPTKGVTTEGGFRGEFVRGYDKPLDIETVIKEAQDRRTGVHHPRLEPDVPERQSERCLLPGVGERQHLSQRRGTDPVEDRQLDPLCVADRLWPGDPAVPPVGERLEGRGHRDLLFQTSTGRLPRRSTRQSGSRNNA